MPEPVGPPDELRAAAARGDHHAVLDLSRAALEERPGDDSTHEARAQALLALGSLEEAERHAADAVRLDPDEVRYRELLAQIRSRRGAHADAAAEYAQLARRDPAQLAWTLAEAAERIDGSDAVGGVEAARRALRLDPHSVAAQLALVRGLIQLGDGAGALAAAARAEALAPTDPEIREVVGDALWLSGRHAAAFDRFRELAGERSGDDRQRLVGKARGAYRQRAGWFGRRVAAAPRLFAVALRLGWLRPA
jgi:tetratricopeptide (TPR) repeat protein